MKDLSFENYGSVWLVRPVSEIGKQFLDETAPEDAQFMGNAMVVEPRYVEGVHTAAIDFGCEV